MPSGAKKRKSAKKKKDHGGAAAPDSSTNPLPSPTPSHESDGEEAPPTPRSYDEEEKMKEGILGLTPMEGSSGNDPSGFEAAKSTDNGREDTETHGTEEIDVIEQVEEVPSPPSLPLLTSTGMEGVSVEFVEKVESTEISVAIAEAPPAADELSAATGKHEIPPTTEQRSSFWSCCGLLDVLTGSQR